jgi:hypothetical protein
MTTIPHEPSRCGIKVQEVLVATRVDRPLLSEGDV